MSCVVIKRKVRVWHLSLKSGLNKVMLQLMSRTTSPKTVFQLPKLLARTEQYLPTSVFRMNSFLVFIYMSECCFFNILLSFLYFWIRNWSRNTSSFCSYCWGDIFQNLKKAWRLRPSCQIGSGWNLAGLNNKYMHWIVQNFDLTSSRWRPWRQRCCMCSSVRRLPASPPTRVTSSARSVCCCVQFLIHRTCFVSIWDEWYALVTVLLSSCSHS